PIVFAWIILPYILFINLLIFGWCAFRSPVLVAKTFGLTAVYFFVVYGVYGSAAVWIKNRYASPGDLFLRIRIMLPMFYLLNVVAIHGAFWVFDATGWVACPTRPHMLWWTILYACIMSTVITFINEGMANWENWKESLAEGEQLKSANQR